MLVRLYLFTGSGPSPAAALARQHAHGLHECHNSGEFHLIKTVVSMPDVSLKYSALQVREELKNEKQKLEDELEGMHQLRKTFGGIKNLLKRGPATT